MLNHAARCLPNECCGLLAMDGIGRFRMVYPLTNTAASPSAFTMDPIEQFGAWNHAERQGWTIGAVFHSHPSGPATPSATDLAQPHPTDWLHLVVSFDPTPHVEAWRIRHGLAEHVTV